MDTTTAVLMAITDWDPTVMIDIEKVRNDIEAIESKQGKMSEAGIKKYAEQYIMSQKGISAQPFNTSSTVYNADAKETGTREYDGEMVLVNRDIKIKVPSEMIWSNKKTEIGQPRMLVFMSSAGTNLKDPQSADLYVEIDDPTQLAQNGYLNLLDSEIKANVHSLISLKLKSLTLNKFGPGDGVGVSTFGISFKEPKYFKEDQAFIIAYLHCQEVNGPVLQFAIVNEIYLYMGKVWSKNVKNPAEIERLATGWLSTLVYADGKEILRPAGEWIIPVYTQKRTVNVDSMTIGVADNMISNIEENIDMSERFCFVSVPASYEDGLINYKHAAIGIGMNYGQRLNGLKELWENEPVRQAARNIYNRIECSDPDFVRMTEEKGFLKGYSFYGDSNGPNGYYCTYLFYIVVDDMLYSGPVYFSIKKDKATYKRIVEEWLSTIKVCSKVNAYPEEKSKQIEEMNQRIEEKRKQKEEEQRRKEELQRQEAEKREQLSRDKAAYQQALEDYQKETAEIGRERFNYVESRLKEKQNELIKNAETIRDSKIQELKKKIAEINSKIRETEIIRVSLGAFRFSEKRECKQRIEQYTSDLGDAENSIKKAEADCEIAVKNAANIKNQNRSVFENEAAEKYPFPPEPMKPESILQEEREIKEAEEARIRQQKIEEERAKEKEKQMKQDIIHYIARNISCTITDLKLNVKSLENISNQKVAKLVTQMAEEGILKREEIQHQAYFSIRQYKTIL